MVKEKIAKFVHLIAVAASQRGKVNWCAGR
jgi:hypothetical protein